MSILYKTTRFADTFTGDKDTNIRVQLLSWDTLDTKAFVEYYRAHPAGRGALLPDRGR